VTTASIVLEMTGQPVRQHMMLLGALLGHECLDRLLEEQLVAPGAGANKIEKQIGSSH
jgi:hypothetical protein